MIYLYKTKKNDNNKIDVNMVKQMSLINKLSREQFQTGVDYSNRTIRSGSHLQTFRCCNFTNTIFEETTISYSQFVNCFFSGAKFIKCPLVGTKFYQDILLNITFEECNLTNTNILDLRQSDNSIMLINCFRRDELNKGEPILLD
jgi:uncharacterized protein YjbI with pentapeptide repeats